MSARCPKCDVDLDDDGTAVRCWRCGWEVRDVDRPRDYADISDEIADRDGRVAALSRLQQLPELLWSAAMIVGAAAVLIGTVLVVAAAATGRPDTALAELTGLTVTVAAGLAVATLPAAALTTPPRRHR